MNPTLEIKKIIKGKSFEELSTDEKIKVGSWALQRMGLCHELKTPPSWDNNGLYDVVRHCWSWYVYEYKKLRI